LFFVLYGCFHKDTTPGGDFPKNERRNASPLQRYALFLNCKIKREKCFGNEVNALYLHQTYV